MADSLHRNGHHGAALALCSSALREPDHPELRVRRARALMALHHGAEAVRDLALVLRLQPDSAMAHRLLCEIALCRGDLATAEAFFDRACRLDPTDPRIRELADVVMGWRAERAASYGRRSRRAA